MITVLCVLTRYKLTAFWSGQGDRIVRYRECKLQYNRFWQADTTLITVWYNSEEFSGSLS